MAPKMKSRQKASQEYWEEREKEALKQTRLTEEQFAAEIEKIYGDMRREVNSRISNWYVRYADESGIDIAEAKKRVSKLDMEEYAELARKYVELARKEETRAQAFTDEANEQMKLYNLTMKVNRLENLKAQIGLELCGGFSQLEKKYGTFLTEQMMEEFDRQSGILAMTTQRPEAIRRQAEAVVNGSFHNATFSERLWNQQDALKSELDRLLSRALIQGLNPRAVAPALRKKFGASEMAADLLMITELCRVQTEAQKMAFKEYGYEEYTFICNGGACEACEGLSGKHFKVSEMQPGLNAPPMHPRCRCSTAAYMDREKFDKWLEGHSGNLGTEYESEEYLKTSAASSLNKDNFNSGPVMDSLNAPEITNSDEIVEQFLNSIEVPNDQRIIEIISKSARHMPEEDLNMILSKGLIVQKTNGANAFVRSRRSRGKDGNLKYVIRLNSNSKGDTDVILVPISDIVNISLFVNSPKLKLYKILILFNLFVFIFPKDFCPSVAALQRSNNLL